MGSFRQKRGRLHRDRGVLQAEVRPLNGERGVLRAEPGRLRRAWAGECACAWALPPGAPASFSLSAVGDGEGGSSAVRAGEAWVAARGSARPARLTVSF